MTKYIIILMAILNSFTSYAQKKTFDIVTYNVPVGWTPQDGNGFISYSKIDGSSWAQIAIYQHRNSEGDIQADFDKDWNELVLSGKTISSPEKTAPQSAEGWTVMSGAGVWQYNGANVTSMLTIYSNNKICISVLCNSTAQPYLKEYQSLLGSLDLDASKIAEPPIINNSTSTNTTSSANTNNGPIVGLWCDYILETSGYMNGYAQYTAGYFRKEYLFNSDGTYIFRTKNWSVYMKESIFIYETGKYSVNGNQLTIAPMQGKGEWWSKTNSSKEWGKLVKVSDYKLEKVTYAFEIKYYSGTKNYSLILKSANPTQRESSEQKETHYSQRKLESLIDNPPGFKTDAENRSLNNQNENGGNSMLSGKIWEGSSLEKTGYGNMQYNTGGFWIHQYQFNTNGTYQFVYNAASGIVNTPVNVLQYETGTYSVNGNQLTITPQKGTNEEWSVGKIDNGMSDSHRREVLGKRIKLLKKTERKLEKITYPFTVEYWEGNQVNVLLLQHAQPTVREGSPGVNNRSGYFETPAAKATKFPDYK
ncbi:MAG: lipocalin family protein [Bacteroidetes bacterium]|nr:lipocalin family protein [Bacteroidota bacterium]MBS1540753.1 lipocalin family protein [Bacteroidota bacterium]